MQSEQLLEIVATICSLVLTGLAIYLIRILFAYIATKTKSVQLLSALAQVEQITETVVTSVAQTYVDKYKKANDFNTFRKQSAKQQAMRKITDLVPEKTVKTVENAIRKDFQQFASDLIEAKVLKIKNKP